MPATTETRSSTVAPLRRRRRDRFAGATLAPHPHNCDGVEQRDQGDEHGHERTIAHAYRPLPVHRVQSQSPPAWSTSKRLKIRNRYRSEKANIRRALRSVVSRQTRIAEPVNTALNNTAPAP